MQNAFKTYLSQNAHYTLTNVLVWCLEIHFPAKNSLTNAQFQDVQAILAHLENFIQLNPDDDELESLHHYLATLN